MTHAHTLDTGWYEYGSPLKARGRDNPGGLVSPDKGDVNPGGESAESQGFQGGLQEGGPRVLVLYQEGCPAVFQEGCGTIPGNSQRGVVGYQFPRRRQRRSWRPGITPDAEIGVVLEAWCYTRAAGAEVVHLAATGFQGIPDCVAR